MKEVKNIYLKYKEIINYVIVGILTTLVSLLSYYGLVLTILNPDVSWQLQLANIISWLISVTFAYITNRKYVFESKNNKILKEASKFYGARVVFMYITVTIFKFNDKIMKILSNIIVLILNYILSKLFVFIKKDGKNA